MCAALSLTRLDRVAIAYDANLSIGELPKRRPAIDGGCAPYNRGGKRQDLLQLNAIPKDRKQSIRKLGLD